MCGRFFVMGESENELLDRLIAEVERRLLILTGESGIARGEVLPASTVAALAMGKNGEIGAFPMTWGYHLQPQSKLLINTRSETALDKPLFRQSMLERRCLIPCSWYFEWEIRDAQQSLVAGMPALQIGKTEKSKAKHPTKIKYAIRPKASGVIYLAGIYRYEENQKLPVLSILTREPAPEIAFIHDRMPVIFSGENHALWLDRSKDPKELLKLCEKEMAYRAE